MAKDFVTASELLKPTSFKLGCGTHLALIGNVILNYKFKLKGKKRLNSSSEQ